jgi:hypothetical protein
VSFRCLYDTIDTPLIRHAHRSFLCHNAVISDIAILINDIQLLAYIFNKTRSQKELHEQKKTLGFQLKDEETKRLADFFFLLYKVDMRLKKKVAQNEAATQAGPNDVICVSLGQENIVKDVSASLLENNVTDLSRLCQKCVIK